MKWLIAGLVALAAALVAAVRVANRIGRTVVDSWCVERRTRW